MKLTSDFSLNELTVSATATAHGIDNTPNLAVIEALKALCVNILQPARDAIGAVEISSGYRCQALNRMVGGVSSSQHTTGEAVDIKSADKAKLFHWIKDNVVFDQLIWENGNDEQPNWVHVSFSQTHCRKQVLRKRSTSLGYELW